MVCVDAFLVNRPKKRAEVAVMAATTAVVASKDTHNSMTTHVYIWNRVVGVTVCVVLVSLFQLLLCERVNIWEFCTSCCWYVCLFSLPYCRLIIFTGIFSCFTLDPCLVEHIHGYAFAQTRVHARVYVCLMNVFSSVLLLWRIFNIKWIYDRLGPYEKQTKVVIWMCVPVSLHASTHTRASKYIHTTSNQFEWLYFHYKKIQPNSRNDK